MATTEVWFGLCQTVTSIDTNRLSTPALIIEDARDSTLIGIPFLSLPDMADWLEERLRGVREIMEGRNEDRQNRKFAHE